MNWGLSGDMKKMASPVFTISTADARRALAAASGLCQLHRR
jgi:hypothetical protein